jgi:hypothetical protein
VSAPWSRHLWLWLAAWLLAAIVGMATVEEASAQSCLANVARTFCTANDVGIADFTVLNGATECFEGDNVDVLLRANLLSTASRRYDIGFFIATDGGNALTGQCVRDFLSPPAAFGAPYNATSGVGPFLNADNDACGDIQQNVTTFRNIQAITVQCQDDDKNGMLDVGACTSWDNNANTICTNVSETDPSTSSKCKCGRVMVGQVIVRKVATLEVIKNLLPDNAPGQFDLLVDGVVRATAVGDLGTTGIMVVAAGTNVSPGAVHTVGEAASGATNLADYNITISCVERGTNNPVANGTGAGPLNVPVQPGQDIICTVTNSYNKATLEIVKNVEPDNPATSWIFNVTGPSTLPPQTIDGDGSTGARTVLAGDYTIAESAGPGTNAADYVTTWSCTDMAVRGRSLRTGRVSSVPVTLKPNQHVVCTFTNTRATGTIVVNKLATGGDDVFTMSAGPLPLPSSFSLSTVNGNAQTVFMNVPTGQYTVSESGIPPGWILDDLQCAETGVVDSTVANGTANISLQLNEVVHCTFHNLKLGQVQVTKVVDWNGFTPVPGQQFQICIQGPSYPTGTESNACQAADFDGGDLVWPNLLPGSYEVTETVPDGGWTVSGSSVSVSVAPGQTATTTVRNTKLPLDLFVSRGSSGFYTRSFNWTLDKQVEPEVHDLFLGDTAQVTYTVAVTRSAPIDQGFTVQGSGVISNTGDIAVTITQIVHTFSDGTPVALNCVPQLPATLLPNDAILCDYSQPVASPMAVTNVATVTIQGLQNSIVVTSEVIFGEPTTVLSDSIVVNDSNGLDFVFTDTDSHSYSKEFECVAPTTTYPNTAVISGTTQSATANVTVNCYGVEVEKSALPSYNQIVEWEISKTAEPSVLELPDGGTGTVTYTIQVTKTSSFSDNFRVSGAITVSNPAPIPATLATVFDILRVSRIPVDVICPDSNVIPPGGEHHCIYASEDLHVGLSQMNDAFAVLENGFEAVGSALVDFSSVPGNLINNEISVSDTNTDTVWNFGDNGSVQYTVEYDCGRIGGYVDGFATEAFDNVATINETGQEASARVEVNCQIPPTALDEEKQPARLRNIFVPFVPRAQQVGDLK